MELSEKRSTPSTAIIFFTVFIYLLGFGIIIPIMPMLSRQFGASALETGLLMSSYSFMQFIFAPFWGKLSDKIGRRPILVYCLLGECLCYLLFAFANSLSMLFLARLLAGLFGASISTASAYISDITPKDQRSKGMALIGVAFGLGFVIGPALGGGLSVWAQKISNAPHFQSTFVALFVSGICLANFIFAFFKLKESLSTLGQNNTKVSRLNLIIEKLSKPTIGKLIWIFFLCSLAMSAMEATLVLFMNDKFSWGVKEASFGFAYIGVIMILTQGYLVRKIIPLLGERIVLGLGLVFFACGLGGIAIAPNVYIMALTMTSLAIGQGLCNPSIMGSISLLAESSEQGSTLGVTQSLSSLGRIFGPALGGFLYGSISQEFTYVTSFLIVSVAGIMYLKIFSKIPTSGKTKKLVNEDLHIHEIGFFQLDNLVKNRIPFTMLCFDTNLDNFYNLSIYQSHLQNQMLSTSLEQLESDLTTKKLNTESALVILCEDGQISQKAIEKIQSLGYMNVYFISGGKKQLLNDRDSSH